MAVLESAIWQNKVNEKLLIENSGKQKRWDREKFYTYIRLRAGCMNVTEI